MTPLLYDAKEVAQLLRLGRSTTNALIASGELRSITIGRCRRVPAEALQEYVRKLDRAQNGTK